MTFEAWLATADEEVVEVAGWGSVTIRELPRGVQIRADQIRQRLEGLSGEEAEAVGNEWVAYMLRHGMVDPKFTDDELTQLVSEGSKKRIERVTAAIINLSVRLRPENTTDEEVQAAERRFPE